MRDDNATLQAIRLRIFQFWDDRTLWDDIFGALVGKIADDPKLALRALIGGLPPDRYIPAIFEALASSHAIALNALRYLPANLAPQYAGLLLRSVSKDMQASVSVLMELSNLFTPQQLSPVIDKVASSPVACCNVLKYRFGYLHEDDAFTQRFVDVVVNSPAGPQLAKDLLVFRTPYHQQLLTAVQRDLRILK